MMRKDPKEVLKIRAKNKFSEKKGEIIKIAKYDKVYINKNN